MASHRLRAGNKQASPKSENRCAAVFARPRQKGVCLCLKRFLTGSPVRARAFRGACAGGTAARVSQAHELLPCSSVEKPDCIEWVPLLPQQSPSSDQFGRALSGVIWAVPDGIWRLSREMGVGTPFCCATISRTRAQLMRAGRCATAPRIACMAIS